MLLAHINKTGNSDGGKSIGAAQDDGYLSGTTNAVNNITHSGPKFSAEMI